MIQRVIFLFLSLGGASFASSQTLEGYVVYAFNQRAIPHVLMCNHTSGDSIYTDQNGRFKLKVDSLKPQTWSFYAKDCEPQHVVMKKPPFLKVDLSLAKIKLPRSVIHAHLSDPTMNRPEMKARIKKYTHPGALRWQQEALQLLQYPRILLEVEEEGEMYIEMDVKPTGEITRIAVQEYRIRGMDDRVIQALSKARNFTEEEARMHNHFSEGEYPRTYIWLVEFALSRDEIIPVR